MKRNLLSVLKTIRFVRVLLAARVAPCSAKEVKMRIGMDMGLTRLWAVMVEGMANPARPHMAVCLPQLAVQRVQPSNATVIQ
ncbi:hypothetical protein BO221_51225 [Archangium sp. Cb G35]|nr:hypothetical protein BO221_51225 [Archangium sp. Cb G35]